MEQRLRITHCVESPLHYSSHLDRMHVWTRAARRAGLPLAYSGGFHPRPRIQVAAALPVGFTARGEMLDLWLEEPMDPEVIGTKLGRTLPEGLTIISVKEANLDEPALTTRVRSAEYTVTVEVSEPAEEIRHRSKELLAVQSLPRQRRGRSYDLRPLIEWLEVKEEQAGEVVLEIVLAARQGATGRPEEVLDALALSDSFFRVCRERLLLAEPLH